MSTGFSEHRAESHDGLVDVIASALTQRGFTASVQKPDGNRPDIRIWDRIAECRSWVDVKTRQEHQPNFAVKHGSLTEYWRLTLAGQPVFIVWFDGDATVDTVYSLTARIDGGPRRPTGRGSNTDFVLVRPGGRPFDDIFPAQIRAVA